MSDGSETISNSDESAITATIGGRTSNTEHKITVVAIDNGMAISEKSNEQTEITCKLRIISDSLCFIFDNFLKWFCFLQDDDRHGN